MEWTRKDLIVAVVVAVAVVDDPMMRVLFAGLVLARRPLLEAATKGKRLLDADAEMRRAAYMFVLDE
jgi:hypothetical protein